MLNAVLNKSWKQHPTKQQLYGYLPLTSQTIQVRKARHAGEVRTNSKQHMDTPVLANQQKLTFINSVQTTDDLPRAMADRDGWWERVKGICSVGTPWWWWNITKLQWKNKNRISLTWDQIINSPFRIYY